MTIEPPIIAVVRSQGGQEIQLIALPVHSARNTDQACDVGSRRCHKGIRGPASHVSPHMGERIRGRIQHEVEHFDVMASRSGMSGNAFALVMAARAPVISLANCSARARPA